MKNNKDKSKTLIYKSKGKSVVIEPIFNSHKICFDFEQKETEINTKPKMNQIKNRNKNRIKNLNFNSKKFRTKTTSPKKDRNIINNIDLNNNNLEFSTEKGNDENILSEFELLYNCIKKKRENLTNKQRSKSGKKEKNVIINKKRTKHSLILDKNFFRHESILGIIYENKKIKQKNEELSKQFDLIKKEFEQIKKDNKDIKEELKEKGKHLKDIKLSMDIFTQELLKLQNIYKDDKTGSFSYNNNNYTKNNSHYNTNANNSKKKLIEKESQKLVVENTKNKLTNDNYNNNSNIRINTNNINNMINTEMKENKNKHYETTINSNNTIQKNKFEKIHQLPLNNINNIIKKQNKERGNSLEVNNFQDTSKLINIETKDATEKENNEFINEKWSSLLNIEKIKLKEKEKTMEINDTNKSVEEKDSIDLSNISLADNLNINEEMYNIALNKNKKIVGKLLDLKSDKIGKELNEPEKLKKIPKKFNFMNDNFNEEFMKYYDKFSDSWRKEVDKMLKKGK